MSWHSAPFFFGKDTRHTCVPLLVHGGDGVMRQHLLAVEAHSILGAFVVAKRVHHLPYIPVLVQQVVQTGAAVEATFMEANVTLDLDDHSAQLASAPPARVGVGRILDQIVLVQTVVITKHLLVLNNETIGKCTSASSAHEAIGVPEVKTQQHTRRGHEHFRDRARTNIRGKKNNHSWSLAFVSVPLISLSHPLH